MHILRRAPYTLHGLPRQLRHFLTNMSNRVQYQNDKHRLQLVEFLIIK